MTLPTARANVAARMEQEARGKPDEAARLATAAEIRAGEQDGWAVQHEVARLEREARDGPSA